MGLIPDEYRGNRCVAVLRRPEGGSWEYYVRVGDSIQAMERDMEDRRKTYCFSYIQRPENEIPEEKDKFLARFEMVNISFLDLVIYKVKELNQSKTAKTSPLDSISIEDILSMQKTKVPAKKEKDISILRI